MPSLEESQPSNFVSIGSPFSDIGVREGFRSDVASTGSHSTGSSMAALETKLKRMKSLLDQGLIDKADYDSFKNEYLANM